MAMRALGNGISEADQDEAALSVQEAELAMLRRYDTSVENILVVQGNIANSYEDLGRPEEALPLRRDVYSGWLRLYGEEHEETLREANNYARFLVDHKRFEEAKALLRKMMPVAQRVLGCNDRLTLTMKRVDAAVVYKNDGATLDDLREAVTRLEDAERTARRVFGGAHPVATAIGCDLREARAALRTRETQDLAQDAFRTARAALAQERAELAQTLADAARQS